MNTTRRNYILPVIVIAQFACTSTWFAGNAVIGDIIQHFHLEPKALGHLSSAVQLGFISGTLVFAVFTISDRYSPSKVFFLSSIAAALSNLLIFIAGGLPMILVSRYLTGFFLAGIYPVGMKIASDYHKEGLGKALGYLVGALVVGTAFPHLVKGLTQGLSWMSVMMATSALSVFGGAMILFFVPDGPYRSRSSRLDLTLFVKIFKNKIFRSAAFGYFGHMWELYAFWTFIPVILSTYTSLHPETKLNIPLFSFLIIGVGGVACVTGGYLSQYFGSGKIAFAALLISFICCLISPFLFHLPTTVFFAILFVWGMAVITDSPQFSTLVAHASRAETKGTAITITFSIGFFITIISIEVLNLLSGLIDPEKIYLILALGPIVGLMAMYKITFGKTC